MNQNRSNIAQIREQRIRKAELLREMGINPYPSISSRTHLAGDIVNKFDEMEGKAITVAGRLMAWREHGAISFGRLQDPSGAIQLYFRSDTVESRNHHSKNLGYEDLHLFDVGDLVEASGIIMKTKRGEISIAVHQIRMLAKSLRPLPEKWVGLRDPEAVQRKRYLDTIMSPDNRSQFESVHRILFAIREFLNDRGFIECLTPVIQPQYGGGRAKPFRTRVNALGHDMYLAISHELYLKRMIIGGFEKVFTIGRYFRNEGIDKTHNPEFSMLETMTAFENYEYNMNLIEDLFRHVAHKAFSRTNFRIRGHDIDFSAPWKRISMVKAIVDGVGIDFASEWTLAEANNQLAELGIEGEEPTVGAVITRIFEERIQPSLMEPTIVFGHPAEVSPLAKPMDSDPRFTERFELFIAGMECSENWTEQNDPIELLKRWREQYDRPGPVDEERHPLDYDFLEALEYGMPPTTGLGPGIERMAMLFTGHERIGDVIYFPMLRPVVSSDNRAIYGLSVGAGESEPTEDIIITADELEGLLKDGHLAPNSPQILIRPYHMAWGRAADADRWKASGYVEVDGLSSKTVRIAGYSLQYKQDSDPQEDINNERDRFRELVEYSVADLLREYCANCEISVDKVRVINT